MPCDDAQDLLTTVSSIDGERVARLLRGKILTLTLDISFAGRNTFVQTVQTHVQIDDDDYDGDASTHIQLLSFLPNVLIQQCCAHCVTSD